MGWGFGRATPPPRPERLDLRLQLRVACGPVLPQIWASGLPLPGHLVRGPMPSAFQGGPVERQQPEVRGRVPGGAEGPAEGAAAVQPPRSLVRPPQPGSSTVASPPCPTAGVGAGTDHSPHASPQSPLTCEHVGRRCCAPGSVRPRKLEFLFWFPGGPA